MDLLKKPSRRLFLLAAATGTGAIAAIPARSAQHSAVPARPSESARSRISEHARKYYRTTRI
jgi:hypothetical protein